MPQLPRPKCKVCDNKARRPIIDAALEQGVSAAFIAREQIKTGWSITPATISRHKQHYQADVRGKAFRPKDLAVLVRDKTIEAIEEGRLTIDDPLWKNVNPGLRAQQILDARARSADLNKLAFTLSVLIAGGSPSGYLAPPELRGGDIVEGELVSGGADDDEVVIGEVEDDD